MPVCCYFCDWFNTMPTAKQNVTPVIHGNREPGYIKAAFKALRLKIDTCNLILNCSILFACVENRGQDVFFAVIHSCLFSFQSFTSTRLAERACSFSATPRFIYAVRHIHTHGLLTLDRSLGLSARLMGTSVAAPEKAVSHVFTFRWSRS